MNKLFSEGTRYLIVGLLTTGLNILVYQVGLWSGIGYLASTTIAFILAVIFAFWANKLYVFKVLGNKGIVKEVTLFIGSRLSTFGVETVGLILLIEGLKIDEMISKIVMNIVVIVLNYVLSKFFIFKHTE